MLSKKKIESISNIAENTNLEVEGRSLWQDAKNRFVKNKAAMVSLFILLAITALVIIGPFLSKYGYAQTDWGAINQAPSMAHLFGTDTLGRDLFVRVWVAVSWTISEFVILAILVAVSALPVKSPVNVPAISPVPVIVGDVNDLFVRVWVAVSWTISEFVMLAILVAVSELPVTSPVKPPANVPALEPVPVIVGDVVGLFVNC